MPATAARVDVGALSGALLGDVSERLAESIVRTIDHLREDDRQLNQIQAVELVRCAFEGFVNIEAAFAKTIVDTLERDGVQTWGLGGDLQRLLGRGGA